MGASLIKLAIALELLDAATIEQLGRWPDVSLPAAFALAARGFGVGSEHALVAYVWSWLEAQVRGGDQVRSARAGRRTAPAQSPGRPHSRRSPHARVQPSTTT